MMLLTWEEGKNEGVCIAVVALGSEFWIGRQRYMTYIDGVFVKMYKMALERGRKAIGSFWNT